MGASTQSGSSVVVPLEQGSVRRLRVSEYHRMVEAGILGEDERVELIQGVLVEMSPQHRAHARVIEWLTRHLNRSLGDEYAVLPQLPLTLGEFSEPEPDVSVVPAHRPSAATEHPKEAYLVVEVSRGWIVNLDERVLEVYRDPERTAARYRQRLDLGPAESVVALAVTGLSLRVADLLGE
jgi:Uma2 family endonuclease